LKTLTSAAFDGALGGQELRGRGHRDPRGDYPALIEELNSNRGSLSRANSLAAGETGLRADGSL